MKPTTALQQYNRLVLLNHCRKRILDMRARVSMAAVQRAMEQETEIQTEIGFLCHLKLVRDLEFSKSMSNHVTFSIAMLECMRRDLLANTMEIGALEEKRQAAEKDRLLARNVLSMLRLQESRNLNQLDANRKRVAELQQQISESVLDNEEEDFSIRPCAHYPPESPVPFGLQP